MAAVRPEFRTEIYIPAPDDLVFPSGSVRSVAAAAPYPSMGCVTATSSSGGSAAARPWKSSSPIPGGRSGAGTR